MFRCKMTKRGVRISYKSETMEKELKFSRVRPLPSASHTWVKAHIRRQDPVYASQNLCMQSLKNRPTYARTKLRMHKYKLNTQARAHIHKSTDRRCPSTFSNIYHPKPILNIFLPLLMCKVEEL